MKNIFLMVVTLLAFSLVASTAHAEKSDAGAKVTAKTVKVEVIDLEEPQEATVRVGDTLQITVPVWTGTTWKVVGEQPSSVEFVSGYLGPTDGMKYGWKIAGSTGKRTIKFVGTDANIPKAPPTVVTVVVTVQ